MVFKRTKIKRRFCFISSPDLYVSGNFPFLHHTPLRFLCTESVGKTHEKLNLELNNIKCLDDCVKRYEEMRRMRPLPSVIQFTQLLSRVVKLEEYSSAIGLFKDFCRLGIPVDEYTMNIAINSYCLSNRVDLGFSILSSFFKRGCVPDAVTFSTLLKGLFLQNRSNDALEFFSKIVRETLCVPNAVTFNTLLNGLCKNKLVDSALKLSTEMSEKGIRANVVTYNTLICGFSNLSRWEEVKMLLKQMSDDKVYPNVITFTCIMDALCKERSMDQAEYVLQIMKQQSLMPDSVTRNVLMNGYCLQGRLDEARKVSYTLASMSIAPDVWSFNILIHGYCKKRRMEDAMHLFSEMQWKGIQPSVVTYNSLMQGFFHVGQCSNALQFLDEFQAIGLKPDVYTYCILLSGLCRNGYCKEALLLLDELEEKGEDLAISYYNIVMSGFCKDGKVDIAHAILDVLASKGLEPNVETYNILTRRAGPPSFEAVRTIDGKFDCGYLVSVKLGNETLNGVLYHLGHTAATCTTLVPYAPLLHQPSCRSRRRRSGDPGCPKPNRSGYNFFFAEKHAMLKSLYPNREREFTKMIGHSWNSLSSEERVVYQNHGIKDKERYQKELKEYKEKLKMGQPSL